MTPEQTVGTKEGTLSRVLFVTRDRFVLESNSEQQQFYSKLSTVFDEVHIMVLEPNKGKNTQKRIADKVWLYRVHASYWWSLPWAAESVAKEALLFNGSPRPDIVVGLDPFEAGLAAYLIAKDFDCPLQVHISENLYTSTFKAQAKYNGWRTWIAWYLLRRVTSVRTRTGTLKTELQKRYSSLSDVEVIPQLYNLSGIRNNEPAFDVHKRYGEFDFVMVLFAKLTADSNLSAILSALLYVLENPTIGLVIVGDGPSRDRYKERAKLLDIEKNTVFVSEADDVASVLKTADLLIEPSVTLDAESHILRAAAAGVPAVAAATELREDLFKDNESALLFPPDDWHELTGKVNKFLNDSELRTRLAQNCKAVDDMRLKEDVDAFYATYRDSIETVLIGDKDNEKNTDTNSSS